MNADTDSKKKSRAWWWGLLALLILVLACIWVNTQKIPQDISSRVTDAVAAWGGPRAWPSASTGAMSCSPARSTPWSTAPAW